MPTLWLDIMSTGVDIPCLRYIAFGALTKSVGKYLQMLGRGTRLDPKTGKFSFKILDFVGMCKKMNDNGKGTAKPNEKVVKPGAGGNGGGGGGGGITVDGILDNPDPASLIQRVLITDDGIRIVDNLPIAKARELFEEGVKSTMDPRIALLKRKAWEDKDYQATEEELALIKEWAAAPDVILSEEQLQRIYEYPAGSVWDFFWRCWASGRYPPRANASRQVSTAIWSYTISRTSRPRRYARSRMFLSPIYRRTGGSISTRSSPILFMPG